MSNALPIPERLGRYRILQKLGEGGMGAVYLAEDTKLRRKVAVKVPHLSEADGQNVINRFYREARIAAAVDHPHICPIHDVGEHESVHFLVMPFIDGTPLSRLVNADRPWPPAQAVALVRKLALAVEVMHQRGLIHRDLKPGNVLIRPSGEPVLMDFGLARSFTGQSRQLTATGASVGTPAYMSPEQVLGQKDIGPATDIYSMGVILYELLTGCLPFIGPLAALYGQILHADAEPPSASRPGLDAGLDAVCLKAMAKEPKQRFASMAELAADLGCYLERNPDPEPPPQRQSPSPNEAMDGRIPCPSCGRQLRFAASLWGKQGRCPHCQHAFRLPSTPAELPTLFPTGAVSLVAPVLVPAATPPLAKEFTNSLRMKFVLIPAGTFLMGSPEDEQDRGEDEDPQHEVEITRPFYMGVYQVTQDEYHRLMGQNPSWFARSGSGADKVKKLNTRQHPVESVSWDDAVAFCRKLSEQPEEKKNGRVYRLPTEAEWEYACRGGANSSTPFAFGNSISSTQANFDGNYPYKATKGPYLERTTPVGSYQPNAFGLFDMHGNVWEWCADWFDENYYNQSPRQDPQGPQNGTLRVLRGGSWYFAGHSCRSACRGGDAPVSRNDYVGFRVVCVAPRTP
ncbi:MAG: SUMF1/EgtB/PvdO family nonheme iron enzyme [Planctomycetes bacterium]|nr:SUMF1/EgtB/PvdO family nonheme iron enzyme [Planctomycetota bacterium]